MVRPLDPSRIINQSFTQTSGQSGTSSDTLSGLTSFLGNFGSASGLISSVGSVSGLLKNGLAAASSFATTVNGAMQTRSGGHSDPRVRLSPLDRSFYGDVGTPGAPGSQANILGQSGFGGQSGRASNNSPQASASSSQSSILSPLLTTNGVMFPYMPAIQFEQAVQYSEVGMVHTNTDYFTYQRTPSVNITITGKFTCQNQAEGLYALAVVHFFRTASKMYFGQAAGPKAGLPPPILRLNGFGTYMFNDLNCILKTHSFSYTDQIDIVPITAPGGHVYLPALFDLTCSLTVQQTPRKMREEFDLDKFRTGALMAKGGWI